MDREGEGWLIAGIAGIARNRKSKIIPLINADDTDRNLGIERDIPGVELTKSFRILIEGEGEGWRRGLRRFRSFIRGKGGPSFRMTS
jgi:hypothetical protein